MRTLRSEEKFTQQLSALLKAEGISGLTVGDLAARLCCSRRRLYALAPTKEALLLDVAKRHFDNALLAGFRAAANEQDPARIISAYLQVGVTSTADLSPAFLKELDSSAEGRQIFDRYQLDRARGLREILEKGIRLGHFNAHNSLVAAEVFLGVSLRIRHPAFLAEAGLTISEAFEEAYAMILDGLLAAPRHRSERASSTDRRQTKRSPRRLG